MQVAGGAIIVTPNVCPAWNASAPWWIHLLRVAPGIDPRVYRYDVCGRTV
jgi:hypothetical protein